MMRCEDVDPLIEDVAAGGPAAAEVARHLEDCARCRRALANARAIERSLIDLPTIAPPPALTTAVMARLRRQRWRTEQVVDWTFNVAVAIGVVLIAGGLAGIAWATGLIAIGGDMVALVTVASNAAAERLVRDGPTVLLAAALLTMTLGVWWWVEGDASF